MIKLMTIPQSKEVLELWFDKIDKLNENKEEVERYKASLEEVIGHANVYVYMEEDEIKGAAIIHEGYYLSDLIYQDEMVAKALIDEIKEKYDELQTDVHIEDSLNDILKEKGFKFLGQSVHDIFSYDENQYEYLKDEQLLQ